MIKIVDKSGCCGCAACEQACPRHCIHLLEDTEGFSYPQIDAELCIECGLCEKVCPFIHVGSPLSALHVYAAKNKDEDIRLSSSSGGIFTLLAEQILGEGGVAFGARFDEKWEVVHDYTESQEGLAAFRGSKYVQSRIGNAYTQAELFLRQGRKVLFSGTPCQIKALKLYLRKEYENLLTVDFVCHGVPSPKVWRMYLSEIVSCKNDDKSNFSMLKSKQIECINFRSKQTGWKNFSLVIEISDAVNEKNSPFVLSSGFKENLFMQAFLANLTLRPCCYACQVKNGKSGSDMTMGDFWGIEKIAPKFDDDKGVSLMILHTEKCEELIQSLELLSSSLDLAKQQNRCIELPVPKPANRDFFFHEINKGIELKQVLYKIESMHWSLRIRRALYRRFGI